MKQVWLVLGVSAGYEDHYDWVCEVYDNEPDAEAHAAAANKWVKDNLPELSSIAYEDRRGVRNPYDTHYAPEFAPWDWEITTYEALGPYDISEKFAPVA